MSELITHFGVDWKLLAAQVVNFSVLFFILKKFAYQPIIRMLHERREKIEEGLRMRAEAAQNLGEIDRLKIEAEREAQKNALAVVMAAEDMAKIHGQEILADTHKKSEAVIADARRIIQQERGKMSDGVYAEAEALVREGIAKVLGKMPAEERDAILIREALAELKTMRS